MPLAMKLLEAEVVKEPRSRGREAFQKVFAPKCAAAGSVAEEASGSQRETTAAAFNYADTSFPGWGRSRDVVPAQAQRGRCLQGD